MGKFIQRGNLSLEVVHVLHKSGGTSWPAQQLSTLQGRPLPLFVGCSCTLKYLSLYIWGNNSSPCGWSESGMFHRQVWHNLTDVSEILTTSIIRESISTRLHSAISRKMFILVAIRTWNIISSSATVNMRMRLGDKNSACNWQNWVADLTWYHRSSRVYPGWSCRYFQNWHFISFIKCPAVSQHYLWVCQ